MVGFILLVINNDSKKIVQLIANATRIIRKMSQFLRFLNWILLTEIR